MSTPWVAVSDSDIAKRWRPLAPSESVVAATLIEDAQDMLEDALENIGIFAPPVGNDRWERKYKRVVATMAKRVLQNIEGFLSESIDDYVYRRDSAVSAGVLYLDDAELDSLKPNPGRHRGAFTITPR